MIVSKHSQRGFSAASREHPIALSRQHLVTHLERQFFVIEAKNHGRFGGGRQHGENRYRVQDGGKFATCLSQGLTMPQITGYYRLTHFGVSRGSTAKVHLLYTDKKSGFCNCHSASMCSKEHVLDGQLASVQLGTKRSRFRDNLLRL